MKCYVTELESHVVLGEYPKEPMAVFAGLLNAEQLLVLQTRPGYDRREEIIVTDSPALLDMRLEFDPEPVPEPPPAPAPPGDAP